MSNGYIAARMAQGALDAAPYDGLQQVVIRMEKEGSSRRYRIFYLARTAFPTTVDQLDDADFDALYSHDIDAGYMIHGLSGELGNLYIAVLDLASTYYQHMRGNFDTIPGNPDDFRDSRTEAVLIWNVKDGTLVDRYRTIYDLVEMNTGQYPPPVGIAHE